MNKGKKAIMIILGRSCNLHCKYCIQRDFTKSPCSDKDVDKVIDFLQKNGEDGDLLSFYGGEPLLYFEDVKRICEASGMDKYKKILATNGKLLSDNIVDWLNYFNIETVVSWDGDASEYARGFDVLSAKEDQLLKVKNLKFHGVLSSKVSIYKTFQRITDFNQKYYAVHGRPAWLDFSPVMPYEESLGIDTYSAEQYRQDVKDMFNDKIGIGFYFVERLKEKITNRLSGKTPSDNLDYNCHIGNCIGIKLNGEITACGNRDDVIASASDTYAKIRKKAIKVNNCEKREERCKTCLYYGVICKTVPCSMCSDADFNLYCTNNQQYGKVLFEEINSLS